MTYATAVRRAMAAPAESVWQLVADLPRMGEWSPENVGGRWRKGSTGPATGAVFVGRNRNGLRRWSTSVTVVACEPGKLFEIAVSLGPFAVSNWRYEFEGTPEGCTVTESWQDHRSALMRAVGRTVGVHDAAHATAQMESTLAALARAAEGAGQRPV